jgi:hypothetical protein
MTTMTLLTWPVSVALAKRPELTENSLGMRQVKIWAGMFEIGSEDGFDIQNLPNAMGLAGFFWGRTQSRPLPTPASKNRQLGLPGARPDRFT